MDGPNSRDWFQLRPDCAISLPEEDELGRNSFAERLAGGLLLPESSPSIVVGLDAPWGWGKTSLINLISHKLKETDAIVINFSPWLVGARDALIQGFLLQLASSIQLKDHVKNGKEAAEQLLRYSSLFSVLKLVPGAEPWATITQQVFKGIGKAAKDATKLKELDVEGQRDRVATALRKLEVPLVVIVDDIDRLTPQEVFDVFRFVKAVGAFDRVSYLLAYDHTHAAESLQQFGVTDGDGFIEKIVQLRASLPAPTSTQLRGFLDRRLSEIGYEDQAKYFPEVLENFSDIYYPYTHRLLNSPRVIVRLVNRLSISYRMTMREVTFGDLVAVEALAVTAPRVYEAIKADPERFLGEEQLSFLDQIDQVKKEDLAAEMRKQVLEQAPEKLRRNISRLIDRLLPIGSAPAEVSRAARRRMGRVSDISRLRIALNLGASTGDVPFDLVRRYFEEPDSRLEIAQSLSSSVSYLSRFVELVSDRLDSAPVNDPPSFVLSLSTLLSSLCSEEMGHWSSIGGLDRELAACIEQAVLQSPPSVQAQFYDPLLRNPGAAWLATRVVELLNKRLRESRPPVPRVVAMRILTEWQRNMENALQQGALLGEPYATSALYVWRNLPSSSFSPIVKTFIASDENFIQMVAALGVTIVRSSEGMIAKWSQEAIQDLGDESEVRDRADRLLAIAPKDNVTQASMLALARGRPYIVKSLEEAVGNW